MGLAPKLLMKVGEDKAEKRYDRKMEASNAVSSAALKQEQAITRSRMRFGKTATRTNGLDVQDPKQYGL
jgi:hypothetical protein